MPKNHITDEMVEDFGMDKSIYFATIDGAVYVNSILSAPERYRPSLALWYLDYVFRGILPPKVPTAARGYWLNLKQSADWVRQGKATGGIRKPKDEPADSREEAERDSYSAYPEQVRDAMRASGQYPELSQAS